MILYWGVFHIKCLNTYEKQIRDNKQAPRSTKVSIKGNEIGQVVTRHFLLGRCWHLGSTLDVNTYLKENAEWQPVVYWTIFGRVTTERTNDQGILEQACSWPVRRQFFAKSTTELINLHMTIEWKLTNDAIISSPVWSVKDSVGLARCDKEGSRKPVVIENLESDWLFDINNENDFNETPVPQDKQRWGWIRPMELVGDLRRRKLHPYWSCSSLLWSPKPM